MCEKVEKRQLNDNSWLLFFLSMVFFCWFEIWLLYSRNLMKYLHFQSKFKSQAWSSSADFRVSAATDLKWWPPEVALLVKFQPNQRGLGAVVYFCFAPQTPLCTQIFAFFLAISAKKHCTNLFSAANSSYRDHAWSLLKLFMLVL